MVANGNAAFQYVDMQCERVTFNMCRHIFAMTLQMTTLETCDLICHLLAAKNCFLVHRASAALNLFFIEFVQWRAKICSRNRKRHRQGRRSVSKAVSAK